MRELELDQELFSIALSKNGTLFWSDQAIALPYPDGYDLSVYSSGNNRAGVNNSAQTTPREDQIRIAYINTPKTILIPSALFRSGSEMDYIALHNLEIEAGEQLDISKPIHGTIALMISPSASLRELGEQIGEFAVASPLQYNLIRAMVAPDKLEQLERRSRRRYQKLTKHLSGEYTLVYACHNRAYVSIFSHKKGDQLSKGLLSTQIVPSEPLSTVGYYLERLDKIFDIHRHPIYLVGNRSDFLLDEIKSTFKGVRCV